MKIAWLSRHELTAEQKKDLFEFLDEDGEIEVKNIVWQATDDELSDLKVNRGLWADLEVNYDVIAGVFPPVALESLKKGIHVVTPVSRQAPELRVGNLPIPFVHVRWSTMNV